MNKLFTFSLILILFACGGGGSTSSVASSESSQGAQPAAITFKNVPESLSMIE
jgi:hypothetical protein